MPFRNIKMEQMNRQYFYASHLSAAELIRHKAGIGKGNCLELFAGCGYLGLALAQITNLRVYLMDSSAELNRMAEKNIGDCGLEDRVKALHGGHYGRINLPDASMNLVISERSVFFWKDKQKIFQEIYRVLAPGGVACVGSGFENNDIQRQVETKLAEYSPNLGVQLNRRVWQQRIEKIEAKIIDAGILAYELNYSDHGLWIVFRKNELQRNVV